MFKSVLIFTQFLFVCLINSENISNHEYSPCNDGYSVKKCRWPTLKKIHNLTNDTELSSSIIKKIKSKPVQDVSMWNNFPLLPIVFAGSSNYIPEGRCKNHVQRFLNDLTQSKLWAVQMFDASTKYPDGIFYGHTKHLGNFDQCYNLKAKLLPDENHDNDNEVDVIEGRYCLIRFRYQRKDFTVTSPKSFTSDFEPTLSAWDAIDNRGDFRRVKRNSVYMALCVPASCSAEEVEFALKHPLKKLADDRGVRLETTLNPSYSQARSDTPKNLSTGTKIFCLIIASIFILVVGSSLYDNSVYSSASLEDAETMNNQKSDFFLCFSAGRNLKSIFVSSESHPGLECIHLIRFILMTCVIIGHRTMQYYGFPTINSIHLEKWYETPASMLLFNGPIVTDGFLGLGGLLLAYGLLQELDRSKRMKFTAFIVIRFLRLTPLYMMVVFFHATLMPLMGSGPYWEARLGAEGEHCSKNWWTNMLYINNYVNAKEICMFQSWYLSVDYHLYIMGLLVLWIFWKLPRILGYIFIGGLIAIGTAIPFFVTYKSNLQPMFLGLVFMGNVRRDPYFVDYYIKSHMRIAPYMVGVLAGIIVYEHKGSTWRLPKTWSRLLFILLAVGLSLTSQSLGFKYFDPNSVLNPIETAAYAGFHRAAFSLGICSIVVLITVGDGLEFYYNFLTPRWAPPLARLTYGAFLVHNLNQSYDLATTRVARVFSVHNAMWDLVSDIVSTFTLSLLLSIGVEGPIRKMERYFLARRPATSRNFTEGYSSNGIKKTD